LPNSPVYRGGLPDRGRSRNPAIPSAAKRRRQSITVFGRTFLLANIPVPALFLAKAPPLPITLRNIHH